ncbi:hypothetical protein MM_2116 [Methanosarcina mazei Go1]|uniref:Uncharacterized protein n=1 Tax=Methanosarcina mazei (strain ATCC BAA-159 / DSM 3647 / Goe1 / Go1 / JCM 11833 / OCM 88) TaxID=192952 RepID=Q8PV58_METMA|nr:hypothetical protein MM_2116 [Methanosarcina mazei Go1]
MYVCLLNNVIVGSNSQESKYFSNRNLWMKARYTSGYLMITFTSPSFYPHKYLFTLIIRVFILCQTTGHRFLLPGYKVSEKYF